MRDRVGKSAVFTTAFLDSSFSTAGATLPLAGDFAPGRPDAPVRDAAERAGALEAEAFEADPLEAADFVVGALEAIMKFFYDLPSHGEGRRRG
jgi:hypothetical protein